LGVITIQKILSICKNGISIFSIKFNPQEVWATLYFLTIFYLLIICLFGSLISKAIQKEIKNKVINKLKERKLRIEDALNSTRAAVEEGIVPGGGTALVQVISEVEKLEATGDEQTGINIIKKALEAPVRQIAENAGLESSVIVAKLKEVEVGYGFNAATEEWVDMIKAGIVDPTKVTRSALQNAASVSSLFLSTEAVVADVSKDEPIQPQMPMM